jgi:hypothetical protein
MGTFGPHYSLGDCMKALFVSFGLVFSLNSTAQILERLALDQSSSEVSWESIENDFVKVIYPLSMRGESVYIANLVEHYSQHVGLTYEIQTPKQFTLVVRPEMAEPNGFVTLAPRRSEWFASSTFSSFVGASEWYQTLAIHEYRHVMQYDHFKRSTVKWLSYAFGDTGTFVGLFFGLQPWYFEGDAVWAETKYTDAGRGRSPLFLGRLKAQVLGEEIPSYDEFVNGTYNTVNASHYMYGYVLISAATNKFGEDFWKNVTRDVAVFPHPFRFYSAFRKFSGESFFDFYNETMRDLRKQWVTDREPSLTPVDYRENIYPSVANGSLYYLHKDLNSYWALYKDKQKVTDLSFSKELAQLSVAQDHAVYAQFLPDYRYNYRGSSDLMLIDLKSGRKTQITHGQRYYSPRLTRDGKRILAVEFTQAQQWNIVELDLQGKKLRKLHVNDHRVAEVYPLNENEVIAIVADMTGHKSITRIHLGGQSSKTLMPASRNNIYALNVDQNENVFFEAQFKGHVDIFKLDQLGALAQCTQAKLTATSPASDGTHVYYSHQDTYGSRIEKVALQDCKPLPPESLVAFNYLGDSASDNLNKFALQDFAEQSSLFTENEAQYKRRSHGDLDRRLFVPHSWTFISGNGFDLSAASDNYLRTLGLRASLGVSAAENANYQSFAIDYKRYYPVFSLNGGIRERAVKPYDSDRKLNWKEKEVGLTMTLPHIKRWDLYTFENALALSANYIDTAHYQLDDNNLGAAGVNFHQTSAEFSTKIAKDPVARSIITPWELSYHARYDNAADLRASETASSYRFFHHAHVNTPGIWRNNGVRLTFDQEVQKADGAAYRFAPAYATPTGYVFSRGYAYESIPEYRKASANYVFPLAYPDLAVGALVYIRQIFSNAFFDTTALESSFQQKTLNSYGLELEFETKFFRLIPLNIGVRHSTKMSENDESVFDIYTNLSTLI